MFGALAAVAWCGAAMAEPAPRSGRYDSLTLVVKGDRVAGVFAEGRGGVEGMPSFSCIFLLHGTLSGAHGTVETWYPGEARRISGTLAFDAAGAALTLAEDHGGCPMTTGSMVGSPYALAAEAADPGEDVARWQGVALVTAKRAALLAEPGPAPKRSPYLVEADVVAVVERRGDWVRAAYGGGKAPVVGWLRAADIAAVEP
ncbi:hypothetical protein [Methylobacterium sp. WL103]|uniref:hypothetical protein n=1 Tax=Methylobacterium sp. WL103 TaxID=2603891 RepID=UPI00164F6794|nr:hypothetical protein [Methylobacterium sp. WL103]